MCSCVFCYFAGLWMIASRFGLIKLLSRYGNSEIFNQIPKNFPNIEYLYFGLAGYTLIFAIITYVIYKVVTQANKEQYLLQQQTNEITDYAENLSVLLSAYIRYEKANNITDKTAEQKLKLIQRQVAALPPVVMRNTSMKSALSGIVADLQNQMSQDFDYTMFVSTLDSATVTINSLRRRSTNISHT